MGGVKTQRSTNMADTKIPITCIEDVICENCIYSFKDERFYTPICRSVDAYQLPPTLVGGLGRKAQRKS